MYVRVYDVHVLRQFNQSMNVSRVHRLSATFTDPHISPREILTSPSDLLAEVAWNTYLRALSAAYDAATRTTSPNSQRRGGALGAAHESNPATRIAPS